MECMGAGRQKDTEAGRKIEGEIGRETGADRDRESGQNGETGGNTTQAQTSTQTCTAYAGEHSMRTHRHAASILQFPTTPPSAPMLFHLFDQAIAFSGQLPHRMQELPLPDPCKKCAPAPPVLLAHTTTSSSVITWRSAILFFSVGSPQNQNPRFVINIRFASYPSCVILISRSLLADNKTARHFRDRHEVIDDDSEAYCWRRSGFFWRMRASLGLACAQATTLASQVFGKGNPRSRAGRTSA